jgi:hypothetical protein
MLTNVTAGPLFMTLHDAGPQGVQPSAPTMLAIPQGLKLAPVVMRDRKALMSQTY